VIGHGGLGLLGWRRRHGASGRVIYFPLNNSGSLAILAAIRRASSRVSAGSLVREKSTKMDRGVI
jgi:hypothetical protein